MTFTVWLLQKTSAATEDWPSHWKRRTQWGSKQERSDYCCVIWVVPQQAGATTVPEAFCVLSSLLPWQENSNHSATTMQCFIKAVVGIQDKKQQPFFPTASSSISVATKSIEFTSPPSDWEALTPVTGSLWHLSSQDPLPCFSQMCRNSVDFSRSLCKDTSQRPSYTKLHVCMWVFIWQTLGPNHMGGTYISSPLTSWHLTLPLFQIPSRTQRLPDVDSDAGAAPLTQWDGTATCLESPAPSTALQTKSEGQSIGAALAQPQFLCHLTGDSNKNRMKKDMQTTDIHPELFSVPSQWQPYQLFT